MSEQTTRNRRGRITGKVTSDRMNKTITVSAERTVQHPVFRKYVKKHTTLKAHDEKEEARPGDIVELEECRPLSKQKHHRLLRIVRRGKSFVAEEGGDA
ncbi:MAG: 30S ribosomal protein S17 [Salinibacterium sp.]|nr:30S ribosomal protein S17 [Planctomycetota bacterium]MCB1281151.1 30S ribosomal protein S17 [Salinibacterium sp.]